ncbi:MAG: sensor domain-containing protein [Candidatus Heimdallarchaeaceae archaeon]|jgi:hypothetical protein
MSVEDKIHELETASYFGVLGYPRSYANLLYAFLTFPIGLALGIYAWVCLPLFAGLSFIIFGLILFYIFLWTLPRIMVAYGYLTQFLVGLPIPDKEYMPKIEGSFFTKAFNALKDKRIGKSLVYTLFLAIPYGSVVFSVLTFMISLAGGLIALPITYGVQYARGLLNEPWELWIINNIPQPAIITILVVAALIGIILVPAVFHISNKLSIWHARMIQKALTR